MEITVLGCGAAYPRPGGACAGFLFSADGTHVWVDAGNGTFSRLQQIISPRDVSALVLTHGHADHISDVLPFMYAIGFDPVDSPITIPVYSPEDVGPDITLPLGATSKAMFNKVFDFRDLQNAFDVGPMHFAPFRTHHPANTFGLRITCGDATVVYTSDTALFPDLASACRDADLLISEATYIDGIEASPGIHMWAREAGRNAKEAGVKRLVLTHIWSTFDPADAVTQAAEQYDGPVEAAVEGARYSL
jgi:ribonuclease BN (tRNA processing enzyme)